METNTASQQAFRVWRDQLRMLLGSITSWVHPLHDLDHFSIKETQSGYSLADTSNRKVEEKGLALKLTFADTELLIGPSSFSVSEAPGGSMLSTGVVTMVGFGMKETCQIHYSNGAFEKFTYGEQEGVMGEISFTSLLASIIPELKPAATYA
ncbi:hypothetical protein M3M50_16310 [Pseudomonas bijieensis]|uniref:hypothetical protein n=1 Tax=Pseudomonas bijieensis TaxID=2681983 RepID=UPI00200BC4A9|nr:hypothetical protein [Pseudomonas bijieensis]UQI28539.1 hypothetical protein M3M50_16310 [Pseudomonas bijieensis]